MRFCFKVPAAPVGILLMSLISPSKVWAQAPVVVQTNVTVRVMAANTTTGNFFRYETPGLNIFKGLKPDIVAIQEFRYVSTTGNGTSTAAAIREMVDATFGTNFVYFRENFTAPGDIPNGIISRWPIIASGSWIDVQVPNRGFAWARIDLPGTNEFYVVSVHLHTDSASSRLTEATNLKSLIQSNFPSNAFIVVAGDLNTDTRSEAAVDTFKTFLSDFPVPTDAVSGGDPDTNLSRSKPYDYVLPSFTLASNQIPVAIGSKAFTNGLVFDSRVFMPLSDVSPVQFGDSDASGMQHMGVLKDFRVSYTVTNFVTVPPPMLQMVSPNVIHWHGVSNLTYTVEASANLTNWSMAGSAFSSTTNFFFTNSIPAINPRFFRVTYPYFLGAQASKPARSLRTATPPHTQAWKPALLSA